MVNVLCCTFFEFPRAAWQGNSRGSCVEECLNRTDWQNNVECVCNVHLLRR
jgi:hypothetical protein